MQSYISISEMAKLHGITRQTLLHYDSIGLFKPVKVEENGYRYYSKHQIPYLREICFLKSLGIGLKEILTHFQARSPEREKSLLEEQKRYIVKKIAQLNTIREYLNQRIALYEEAVDAALMQMNEPFLRCIGPRQAIFAEYLQPIDRENLHITLMGLWQELFKNNQMPAGGFGSILKQDAVPSLRGAGSCIFVPYGSCKRLKTVEILAGEYVCMYKYGMPYDTRHVAFLLRWLEENGYALCGDIVDVCLLDTTFYQAGKESDFCMLQAPVLRKEGAKNFAENT